jgi:hypothetical protein
MPVNTEDCPSNNVTSRFLVCVINNVKQVQVLII